MVPLEGGSYWELRDLERECEEKRVHEFPEGWLPRSRPELCSLDAGCATLDEEHCTVVRGNVVEVRVVEDWGKPCDEGCGLRE